MDKKYIVAFLISGIVILLLWALTWLVPFLFLNYPFRGFDPGTFGDMFGSVNALFSGLAFAGFLVTMWMQYDQLKLQREDLKIAIDEQTRSRVQFEQQSRALIEANELVRNENRNKLKPFIWIPFIESVVGRIPRLFFVLRPTNHPFRVIHIDIEFPNITSNLLDEGNNTLDLPSTWIYPLEAFSNDRENILDDDLYIGFEILNPAQLSFQNNLTSIIEGSITFVIQDLSGNIYHAEVHDERFQGLIIGRIQNAFGTNYEILTRLEDFNHDYLDLVPSE